MDAEHIFSIILLIFVGVSLQESNKNESEKSVLELNVGSNDLNVRPKDMDEEVWRQYRESQRNMIYYSSKLESNINNPISEFYFLTRIKSEAEYIHDLLINEYNSTETPKVGENQKNMLINAENQLKQLESDLITSINNILMIQEIYELSAEDIAMNKLSPDFAHKELLDRSAILSEEDCFLIGRHAMDINQPEKAIEWIRYGLMWASEYKVPDKEDLMEIFKDLAYAMYQVSDIRGAVHVLYQGLQLDPEEEVLNDLLLLFRSMFKNNVTKVESLYSNSCREEKYLNSTSASFNVSRYLDMTLIDMQKIDSKEGSEKELIRDIFSEKIGNKLIKLMRIKAEQVHQDPKIFVIHDIISNNEVNELIKISNEIIRKKEDILPFFSKNNADITEHSSELVSNIVSKVSRIIGDEKIVLKQFKVFDLGTLGHMKPSHDFGESLEDSKKHFVIFLSDNQSVFEAAKFVPETLKSNHSTVDGIKTPITTGNHVFPYLDGVSISSRTGSGYFYESNKMESKQIICPLLRGRKWIARISFGNKK